MKQFLLISWTLIAISIDSFAQDTALLSIDNKPVMKTEFERIYHKNNNVQGYDAKPVAEYLDMFINFKLKVHEAEKQGYDTLASFISELAGYKDQLSKPYLQDRKLIDQLVMEAYQRTLTEVNASHVMVKLPLNPTPADTLAAYNKVLQIRNRLVAGESFDKLAREESEDPSAKFNNGTLGWFSAFSMVYAFEDAAYKTAIGDYSMPVKSKYGYHVIRVNEKRDALGEIKLAHILVRAGRNENPEIITKAKEKIDACYKQLEEGSSFIDLVKLYSEDAGSSRNTGQMRWLRSGELPADIEGKVFALTDSGSYTGPVQSDYGWHIFQLQGKRPIAPFNQMKSQLEERIMMDERGKQTEESFYTRLMKEYGLKEYPENITFLAGILDSSIYSGTWEPASGGDLVEPVFEIGNTEFSQKDLADFMVKTKRYNKKISYTELVNTKCNELIRNALLDRETQFLEEKYPAFKYLMEEYHDGILLFNIMDKTVWSRAISDSTGLRDFYKQQINDYQWKERADISVYTIRDETYLKPVIKYGKKRTKEQWSVNAFIKKICAGDTIPCVEVEDHKFEQGEPAAFGEYEWKKGFVKTIRQGKIMKVIVVNNLVPPAPKTFEEIQGQVTADYQNYLDKQWIETLRAKYPVVINQDVLEQVK